MKTSMRIRDARLVILAPLLAMMAGCGASHARFVPTSGEARSSLEAALAAWRDGKAYGDIEAKPPIRVVDSAWQGGRQLETFQIGNEEDLGDGTKQFVVTLRMKKANADQQVRYVVHGRDPVWVFTEEEYQHMLNMDNKPDTAPLPRAGSRRVGKQR
jgi:hypothetical protein